MRFHPKTKRKLSKELTELLKKAVETKMTPEEIFEQKVSWVYGQMMNCVPNITKEQVRDFLGRTR